MLLPGNHWEEDIRPQMRLLLKESCNDYGTVLSVSRLCISGEEILPYEKSIAKLSRAPVMKVRLRDCSITPIENRN